MNSTFPRRRFLRQISSAAALLSAGPWLPPSRAAEPFDRKGPPRLLLALAAYSFRNYFKDINHPRDAKTEDEKRIDMFEFIDFCAEHGCAGAEVTSYYFPAAPSSEYFLKLKRHAFLRGVEISGTAVGNTFTLPPGEKRDLEIASVKTWIDRAHLLGAPHIRIFAGGAGALSKTEAKKLCVSALEECCDYAGGKGILLGLENHGGIVAEAEDLLDLVRSVQSPWLGVNLDTGNFHTPDPYGDLVRCAPYAVNVQLKVEIHPRGAKKQEANLDRLIQILRDANYQGYVALEYEASPDPWKAVPKWLKEIGDRIG